MSNSVGMPDPPLGETIDRCMNEMALRASLIVVLSPSLLHITPLFSVQLGIKTKIKHDSTDNTGGYFTSCVLLGKNLVLTVHVSRIAAVKEARNILISCISALPALLNVSRFTTMNCIKQLADQVFKFVVMTVNVCLCTSALMA